MKFKVLVVGDYGVGKTSLFHQIEKTIPGAEKKPSIRLELIEFTRMIEGKEVTVNLIDIPGRELSNEYRSKHYLNTNGALVVYDITSPHSFRHTPFWIEELFNYSGFGNIPVVIVGNKSDMREVSQRTLNPIDAKEYVFRLTRTSIRENIENHYAEISSKSGKGISQMIDKLIVSMINHREFLESKK
ncbi:MAG: GTPase KRas precursor [Candidatus Heimdallarchaeota archaeon AB_125]|nr:MAG: GTPase KRas precursor [Candidatus Heimdallarchaeota archaeon AB_125]